jgi:hypothetical protein
MAGMKPKKSFAEVANAILMLAVKPDFIIGLFAGFSAGVIVMVVCTHR